jgi:hypothetical protein
METPIVVRFDRRDFNAKCNNLLEAGYDEYLTALEDGVTHSIFTNTDRNSEWNGSESLTPVNNLEFLTVSGANRQRENRI